MKIWGLGLGFVVVGLRRRRARVEMGRRLWDQKKVFILCYRKEERLELIFPAAFRNVKLWRERALFYFSMFDSGKPKNESDPQVRTL